MLNDLDERIVHALAEDARRSFADIGQLVGLSAPAVKRRVDRLRATGTFRIQRITENAHDARGDITAGRARIGIVIPPDYHDKRTRQRDAKVLVLIDGSDSTVSAQALASVNGLVASMNIEEIRKGIRAPDPVGAQPPQSALRLEVIDAAELRIRRLKVFDLLHSIHTNCADCLGHVEFLANISQ